MKPGAQFGANVIRVPSGYVFGSIDEEDLYAQKLDLDGFREWASGGQVISTLGSFVWRPVLAPESADGAFFAWMDDRSGSFSVRTMTLLK